MVYVSLSHSVLVKKRNYSATSFMPPAGLEMRLDNDATHLILDSWKRCCAATAARSSNCKACTDAQSRRKETAKREKGVFRDALMHPPDVRPRTPAGRLRPLHPC